MLRKSFTSTVFPIGPRTARFVISDGATDDVGDQVVQDGLDLKAFRSNPVVLWSHDPSKPIGTASNLRQSEGRLVADLEFAPEGVSSLADEICGLVKAGVIKSTSVGFDAVRSEPMDPARPRGPQRYLQSVLREISVVSLPANPRATVLEKAGTQADPGRAARMAKAEEIGRRIRENDAAAARRETPPPPNSISRADRATRMAYAKSLATPGSSSPGYRARTEPVVPGLDPAVNQHVARSVAHANAVHDLQRRAHPSQTERMAEALRRRSRYGYGG